MKDVMILTGAGQIGMAIARRMGYGMKIVIGDKRLENAEAVADTMNKVGFDAVPVAMDLSNRSSILSLIDTARQYGEIAMLVNAAGVSPSQASVETILKVDLYGTAVLLEEVGKVIKAGRRGRNDFQPVGTSPACAYSGRRQATCLHTYRGTVEPRNPATPQHPRYAPRLSIGEALQREAGNGRGRQVGQA